MAQVVLPAVVSGPGWSVSIRADDVTGVISRLIIVNQTPFRGNASVSDGVRVLSGSLSPFTNRNVNFPNGWVWEPDILSVSVWMTYV